MATNKEEMRHGSLRRAMVVFLLAYFGPPERRKGDRLEGDPATYSSKGKSCGKSQARVAELYYPNRPTKPLKRTILIKALVLIQDGRR
jgi:anaerobic selenocysteine-containing dehydrogenase